MYSVEFLWSKFIKKIRGRAILDSDIDPYSCIGTGSHIVGSTMKKYSFCGYDCQIINCEIGMFCSIADNVMIGGARHPIEWAGMSPVFYSDRDSLKKKFATYNRDKDKHTIIGNDVWIGANAIIIQGVNIGSGAVIGAGSVVTKDVPAYAIVAGNPAKLIRMRFSEEIISQMENIQWWNLNDEKLFICAEYIKDPLKFIAAVKSMKE